MLTESIQRDIAVVSRISSVTSILKLVAEMTGMRVTMVAKVTPDSWTACAAYDRMEFGLQVGTQLDVATTLCREVCDSRETIVIKHASLDTVYQHHRTPKMYNIESYIAIPILEADGSVFGTLCAIDSKPAELSDKTVAALTHFTELIAVQFALEAKREAVDHSLRIERKISQLREQFIAVLGHDLRSPLAGIASSVEVLREIGPEALDEPMLEGLEGSVQQMSQLIHHTLDFARTRMGEGLTLTKTPVADLGSIAQATIDELLRTHKSRKVDFVRPTAIPATVDAARIRQMLSNLIGNALQHSPASSAVSVRLEEAGGAIRISVSNQGDPLPDELMPVLFEPFHRARSQKRGDGLGLGLYIAAEIAKAHAGSISADSHAGGTTFTVLLPGKSVA